MIAAVVLVDADLTSLRGARLDTVRLATSRFGVLLGLLEGGAAE
jgi:hypothetical protein